MASYYAHWQQNFWLDTFWPEELWYSDDATYAGSVSVTLESLTPALTGDFSEPGAVTGTIQASLGPLTSNIPGSTAATILFDLQVNISVNWKAQSQGLIDGTIAVTLGDLAPALSGIAWEQSYTDGQIESQSLFWPAMFWDDFWTPEFWLTSPNLDGVTAAFTGTLIAPGAYVGSVGVTLGGISASLLGNNYQPANFNGRIDAVLGDLIPALSGEITDPIQSGSISASLDGLTGLVQALFIPSGSLIGRVRGTLDGVGSLDCYGQVFIRPRTGTLPALLGDLLGDVRGLSLPEGAKWGPLHSILTGIGSVMEGTNVSPRLREKAVQPSVTEIDWKTLCDQHNLSVEGDYDYEFSSGRRFSQG